VKEVVFEYYLVLKGVNWHGCLCVLLLLLGFSDGRNHEDRETERQELPIMEI
jgi:hypothetical protein